MDGPIPLTSTRMVGNRRQIYISPAAERIISKLQPRSVYVVSVVGPMRKGKSHLANLLCKRKSGFPLGDEMESKTKDFWFWIGPHPYQSDRYLMVIDTEGLGDFADPEQNDKDIKCLVLATLLSNHLVFNLQGNPDSAFVSNLRLMGDLAERIRVQKDGSDEGKNLGEHFPELWVAVQDVHQQTPERNGRRLTPDEFLEDILKQRYGFSEAIHSHNQMTATVKTLFPKRHLRLIPGPSIKSHVLRNLDKAGDSDLETDYKDAVDNFTREIWTSGLVKRVNGDDITTTGLLHTMQYYVRAINDPNTIPSVLGAHEAMVEGECRRASDEHMKQFQKTVEETVEPLMPIGDEECNSKIKAAVEKAVAKLSADVGKWDKHGTWKRWLKEKLETKRLALLMINGSKSKGLCEKIMKEVEQTVRQKVERGDYNRIGGFDTYKRDMDDVYNAYKQRTTGKGPAVKEVLDTFQVTETTRRKTIEDADCKLVEEDRRVKEEQRRRREAEMAVERAEEAREQERREMARLRMRAEIEEMRRRNAEADFAQLAVGLMLHGLNLVTNVMMNSE